MVTEDGVVEKQTHSVFFVRYTRTRVCARVRRAEKRGRRGVTLCDSGLYAHVAREKRARGRPRERIRGGHISAYARA